MYFYELNICNDGKGRKSIPVRGFDNKIKRKTESLPEFKENLCNPEKGFKATGRELSFGSKG